MTPEAQFPNYLINKAIVLSNQQLVKFYENNNLELCDLQQFFKKLNLAWGGVFFETPCTIKNIKYSTLFISRS